MASSTRAYLVVLLIMAFYAGTQILSKVAFNRGIDTFAFSFYRIAIATIVLIPVALVLERKKAPPLSSKVAFKIFLHALYGITAPINLFSLGLKLSNSTPISALFNLIPVTTFVLAILFRMETLNLKRIHGFLKATGVLLCFTGVVVLAFYSGPELKPINHHHLNLYHAKTSNIPRSSSNSKIRWAFGVLLMILATTCWSFWHVMQGPLLQEYPSKLLNATLQSIFATFQSLIVTLILQRNFSKWKLGLDITLLAAIYVGIFASALVQYLQIWVIQKRGPVFLAMNIPITLVITFSISWTFLGEIVHLGSIIGAILMIGGLYNVLWGKSREQKAMKQQKQEIEQEKPLEYKEATVPVAENQV
ncbi:WAT1-related protein [Rhynchospora pubera]|uniref:WAT1-related protein n=1 Tax=Rhynchospora pubera TaxID=906938 RepID=A0AAV8BQL4_9POAL|nr:WAT1-related protein [Rhynchospora pubera]KAJ4801454.1 WAT1-related protein [Rhynchospora pubera]